MNRIPSLVPDVDDGFILDVFDEIKECDNRCIVMCMQKIDILYDIEIGSLEKQKE